MEFFQKIFSFPLAEQMANLHGLLYSLSPLFFGAILVLTVLIYRGAIKEDLHKILTYLLGIQTVLLFLLSVAGIIAYVAYRTAGGAREFLLKTPETAWLHEIVFEYKEYLGAIAPWLLIMTAFSLALYLGPRLYQSKSAQRFILVSNIVSGVFVFLVGGLAVLVAKVAPLIKFNVGSDLLTRGGNTVVLASIVVAVVLGGLFWWLTRRAQDSSKTEENYNSFAAIMYGSSIGLTVAWVLNMIKTASSSFNSSLPYIASVGPYSGVITWSLIAVVISTLIIRLLTMRVKSLSLDIASVVLFASAILQIFMFFPPFYKLFLPK